jgi:hypothetical protein
MRTDRGQDLTPASERQRRSRPDSTVSAGRYAVQSGHRAGLCGTRAGARSLCHRGPASWTAIRSVLWPPVQA